MENCLDHQGHGMVINGLRASGWTATSGIAQVLVMGLTQEQAERTVSEFVPDTELGEEEAVDVLEGRAALQTNNLGHGLTGAPTLAKASVPGTEQPRATRRAGLGSSTAEKTRRSWWAS